MNDELLNLLGDKREENRVAELAFVIADRGRIDGDTIASHHAIAIAAKLASVAGLSHSLCEEDCNAGLSEAQEKTLDRRKATFARIAELIGLSSKTGGDPRGACAYLIDPADERAGDGWGGGWAVYR